MTTVVGILNKRGVAIAADSAVTRNNGTTEKYTKNGNKMIRLCESVPVSVMLTGNNEFLGNPWEVIIRRYRSERGKIRHETVKAAADDFFDFLSESGCFWDEEREERLVCRSIDTLFDELLKDVAWNERQEDGTLVSPSAFAAEFRKGCRKIVKNSGREGQSPHFAGYKLEDFRRKASRIFDRALSGRSARDAYPGDLLAGHLVEKNAYAILVFTGYGTGQKYPSLVAATVDGGFDGRVNYHIGKKDIVEISDRRPVAICPFAQTEVINALLCGADHESFMDGQGRCRLSWTYGMTRAIHKEIQPSALGLSSDELWKIRQMGIYEDARASLEKDTERILSINRKKWERALERYDLRSMAELAECLVDLTGFQRILTFQQEGVGGAVDLAVISKTDGFCWLRRKDWYPRYSPGQYGNFGI